MGQTSLGRSPLKNVKCLSSLKEGKDYKMDLGNGIIIPLKDLGDKSYEFEFDWIEQKRKTPEEELAEWKTKWQSAKTVEKKLDVIAEKFGWAQP